MPVEFFTIGPEIDVVAKARLHIYYSGRVQGVGFRFTVKSIAAGFDVAGSVRNLSDGRVELTAEGRREELESFRETIRKSELGHFIWDEEVTWSGAEGGVKGFSIDY